MNKNYKEVQDFTYNKNEKIFVKCDDYKLNMFYNFRRKLTVDELPENKIFQYGKLGHLSIKTFLKIKSLFKGYKTRAGDGSFHEAIKIGISPKRNIKFNKIFLCYIFSDADCTIFLHNASVWYPEFKYESN